MKKRILLFIIFTIFIFTGCNNSKDNNIEETTVYKEPVICINNLNLQIVKDRAIVTAITFHILSNRQYSESDVKIDINIDTEYELTRNESRYCTNRMPFFYDNSFNLAFYIQNHEGTENESFNSIDFTIDDIKHTVDIGQVDFIYSDVDNFYPLYKENYIIFKAGLCLNPSPEQYADTYSLSTRGLEVKKECTIKNIEFITNYDNFSLVSTHFISTSANLDFIWKPGTEVTIPVLNVLDGDLILKRTNTSTNGNTIISGYVVITYECEGKEYKAYLAEILQDEYNDDYLYSEFCKQ